MENESVLLEIKKVPSDKRISQRMNINIGTDLFRVKRLRKVDKMPVALEWNYIIAEYFPGLDTIDLQRNSLYQLYEEKYQVCVDRAEMQLSVAYASQDEAELLDVNTGDALIKEEGRTFDYTNRFIEFTENFMRIDRFQFVK